MLANNENSNNNNQGNNNAAAVSSSFRCFRHPQKNVEAVCTEPFCNHYRFFCVTCFLEHSPHFINHKSSILELGELLHAHQSQIFKSSGVSEIDQNLHSIKSLMREYEALIKQKKNNYHDIFREIEKRFEEAKQRCFVEVEEYLDVLVHKQLAHYNYLKMKVEKYKQELHVHDWRNVRRSNSEPEITSFFETIIKSPLATHKDFKNEVRLYVQSFQRNIQELDNLNTQKLVNFSLEEFTDSITEKFNDLKEVLIVPNEEYHQTKRKIKSESFQFKSFKTPSSDTAVHNQTDSRLFDSVILNNGNMQRSHHLMNIKLLQQQQQVQAQNNSRVHANANQGHFVTNVTAANQVLDNSDSNIELEAEQPVPPPVRRHSFQNAQQLSDSKIAQSVTHTDGITCIILYESESIRNKKIIATGSLDMSIRLWHLDNANFEHMKTLLGHTFPITCLQTFLNDGIRFLASACQNHEIKIWNPRSAGNELVVTLLGHFQGVQSLLHFNEQLISGSRDKTIKVWDLQELKCVETITQDDTPTCLAVLKNSSAADSASLLVASCGDGFRIYTQNSAGLYQLKSFNKKAHRCGLSYLQVIANNDVDIATSGADGLIKLWNLEKGLCVGTLKGHTQAVYCMKWCESKQLLFSASCEGSIAVWDLKDQIRHTEVHHLFREEQAPPFGEFIILQEFGCILSVGNGNNFIKIIHI